MTSTPDLSLPLAMRRRRAHQLGFADRLAGRSRYASPYANSIEKAAQEGRRPGWVTSLNKSWVEGWEAADSLLEESVSTAIGSAA